MYSYESLVTFIQKKNLEILKAVLFSAQNKSRQFLIVLQSRND